eukprot:15463342-Alexandrium_andersonii.AAC.1
MRTRIRCSAPALSHVAWPRHYWRLAAGKGRTHSTGCRTAGEDASTEQLGVPRSSARSGAPRRYA